MNHTTAEGRTVPLSGMTDDHLINTIKCFSGKLIVATKEIECADRRRSKRGQALYGKEVIDPDEYAAMTDHFYRGVGPYVLEATCRGLDVREIITAALGRDSKDEEAPGLPPLVRVRDGRFLLESMPEGLHIDEHDWEDEH